MARDLLDRFFSGIADKPAFLPFGEELAVRVGGASTEEMQTDPAVWGSNVVKTARLLEADGLVLGFNYATETTEIINTRASPEFENLHEALNRVGQTDRSWAAIVAAIAGPISLAKGDAEMLVTIKQQCADLVENIASTRPDLLILVEDDESIDKIEFTNVHRKAFNTLKNVAGYFNVPLAVYLKGYTENTLKSIGKLKVPYLFLGTDVDGNVPDPQQLVDLSDQVDGLGLPIDFSNPDLALDQATVYTSSLKGTPHIFTSLGNIPADCDLEASRSLIAELRKL